MTPTTRDRRRGVLRLVALAAIIPALGLAVAEGAGGHARVEATTPADGATVEQFPDSVSITFAVKPPTVEGDPLLVYDPHGRRVDDGDVQVADDSRVLSVGVTAPADPAAGRYEVRYRVVSADTHVLTGRFGFTVPAAAAAVAPDAAVAFDRGEAIGQDRARTLVRAGPVDTRPEIMTGTALAALAVAAWRRGRRAGGGRRAPLADG